MLELEVSKSGKYTLKYNGKYIHSKYDPEKESRTFIESKKLILEQNTIVIYGCGLGYHVREIFKRIGESRKKVYLFESNNELFKAFKKYNKDLLYKENLIVVSNKNKEFMNILKSAISEVKDIIIHKKSLNTIKSTNKELYNLFNNYEKDRMLINKYSSLLNKNLSENLQGKFEYISKLIERKAEFKKKWILVSAGPSLDIEISKLAQISEHYNIISVGTAAKTLLNNNIVPNLIVIIDGSEIVKEQLKGISNDNIKLCFLSTASRWAVNEYKGKKYIFFNEENDDGIIIYTGKTVAVAALDIIIKLGAEEIVFIGQDLAYINGRSHIKLVDDMYKRENSIYIGKENPKVLSIDGEYIYTNNGYIHFKNEIEKIIRKNKGNIQFINCSKGAFIEGCLHLELKEILNKYK